MSKKQSKLDVDYHVRVLSAHQDRDTMLDLWYVLTDSLFTGDEDFDPALICAEQDWTLNALRVIKRFWRDTDVEDDLETDAKQVKSKKVKA
jgi:hypothetical protein